MKKLIILFVLIFSISACKTQYNVNNFYDRYQNTENSMSFKAPLFLASLMLDDDQEFNTFKEKVKSVRVLSLQDLDDAKHDMVKKDIQSALTKDGFENWFNVNQDGMNINVSAQNKGKAVKNVVVSLQGSDNLIFVNAKTQLTENELVAFISKLMKAEDKN
ncbi:DUF4252 domain-containing protein [Weeksellaceae bacterium KMM 9724]|uniref:DUF4252 domain-containing protein n=1 Tax=Profundicola chukchiensis TaxID=2961959 RepID=UPI0024391E58|nr:DUF4252 domain-containing protein [Profundicola chukchiensis]MDG4949943.1 DUF4252 domain-containing protein [Profundicola chukchiensis]